MALKRLNYPFSKYYYDEVNDHIENEHGRVMSVSYDKFFERNKLNMTSDDSVRICMQYAKAKMYAYYTHDVLSKMCVDHIDSDKTNDAFSNLQLLDYYTSTRQVSLTRAEHKRYTDTEVAKIVDFMSRHSNKNISKIRAASVLSSQMNRTKRSLYYKLTKLGY